jgi:hypothetical protein
MAKTTTVKAAGLFLGPNDLGSIPEGALSVADNVVIRKDNVIELRRGVYAVSAKLLKKLKSWKGVLLGHDGSTILSRSNAAVDAWTDYSEAVDVPTGGRVEMVEGGGNLYLTSNDNPRRLDALASPIECQSIPPCGFASGTLVSSGGTALLPLKTVSYRVVFGKYDANDRLILGKPSGRTLVVNTDAVNTYDLSCYYDIPPNLPIGTFARLYRTESVDNGIDPGDEHGLVKEEDVITSAVSSDFTRAGGTTVTITFASPHGWPVGKAVSIYFTPDVTGPPLFAAGYYFATVTGASTVQYTDAGANGSVVISRTIIPVQTCFGCVVTPSDLDSVPDGYLGAALYTNPSQGRGIADAADPIYGARHIESYQGAMFFGDITYPSKCDLYLLAVGGTDGLQVGDTITINGVVFTGVGMGIGPETPYFEVYSTGTPAKNIEETIQNLAGAVDAHRNTNAFSRPEGGPDDVPGYMAIQTNDISTPLTVTVSRSTAWNIQNLKSAEHIPNEVRWSLSQQPDMTPLVDYARVGNLAAAVKRMIATRNALFIFKEDGLYVLRGTVSPWTIELLDPSVILTAPESAVVLDNQIYCLTTRGVVRCSENGVTLLSRPIEPALENLDPDDVEDYAFGVGYEEDHAYLLWIPSTAWPYYEAGEAYVYDVYTDSWVRRTDVAAHGIVHLRKLYLASSGNVKAERKLWTTAGNQDYELADDSFAVTITVGGTGVTEVTLASATNVLVGDALVQSTSFAIVISKAGNVLTLDRAQTWAAAAATSYRAISGIVQWSPRLGGDPSAQHRFIEVALLFRALYFAAAEIGLSSAHDPSWTTIALTGSSYGWTGAQVVKFALRALVDRQHAVSTQLDVAYAVAQALTPWRIQGLSVKYRDIGDRTSK